MDFQLGEWIKSGMLKLLEGFENRLHESRHKLATAAVVVLMLVLGYHAIFGANGLIMYGKKRQESQGLAAQIQSLQQENDALEQQIKALKSDPKTIEKEARERLRYARPGEVIYTIPGNSAQPPSGKK
jgi:cell division protein FtsB